MRTTLILSILILFNISLNASEPDFGQYMQLLLNNDLNYQHDLNQWERAQAEMLLNNSLKIAEVNLSFQRYLNDIERNDEISESSITNELSLIDESDSRMRIELSRKFFPMDFDETDDSINNSLDLLNLRMKVVFCKTRSLSNIIDDLLDWYEAEEMLPLIKKKIELLNYEKTKLTEQEGKRIISPQELIDNLEELEKQEKRQHTYRDITCLMKDKYGIELIDYINSIEAYITKDITADTLYMQNTCECLLSQINRESSLINRKITFSRIANYLPELTASISYNWRQTYQDWDITIAGEKSFWDREQSEEYPELKLNLSFPLNIFSNYSGKKALVNNYKTQLQYIDQQYFEEVAEFQLKSLSDLQSAQTSHERKKQLLGLYEKIYHTNKARIDADPEMVEGIALQKFINTEYNYKEALLEYKLADMKLGMVIYLINSFGDIK